MSKNFSIAEEAASSLSSASRTTLRRAVGLALGVAMFAATALPALAQTSGPAVDNSLDEVVVTGSRIRGIANVDSPSPISVMTADEIALTKATNIEDILGKMTGVTQFTTLASNNGGGGSSQVALRDLGPSRTLILIDGQRLIPVFGASYSVPDLNSVPINMVERIEVLRGGASSIYGADAIGGVINIITKKSYDGVSLDLQYGLPTDKGGGGQTRSLSGTIGVNSDKGNVVVGVSWDHIDPVAQSQRPWADDPHLNQGDVEGGSTYRSQLNVLQNENTGQIWIHGVPYSNTDPATAGLVPNTVYLPGKGQLKLNAGAPSWNYLTQGLDRKEISLNAHYDIAPNTRFVIEGFFSDRNSEGSLRPEPLLGDSIATTTFNGFYVPDYYPGNTTATTFPAFLTPDQFGPRRYEDDSKTSRIRVGLEGDIGTSGFKWEAGYVDQHNSTIEIVNNEGNFDHLAQLSGQSNCIDVPGGCVAATAGQLASSAAAVAAGIQKALVTSVPAVLPNFFNGPNMFSAAQVAYLTFQNTDVNTSTERYAYADVNGTLFNLPAGPVRVAVGAEHRNEYAQDNPDTLVQEGFGPNQSAPTGGGYDLSSVYAELNIPILKDIPGIEALTVSPSGRWDKYNTFGSAVTWKMGLEWTPIKSVRVRGSYSTGFRAPSVSELFSGQAISDLTGDGDPCDTRAAGYNGNSNVGKGVLAAGSTCSRAVAGGAPVTAFNSSVDNVTAEQQQVLVGGNPGLSPEKSFQYGYGVVFTPTFLPGFSFSADYYNIRIDNTVLTGGIVGATSVDAVLLGCYGPAQNQAYCNLIKRDPVSGSIIQIGSLNDNFGTARVTGIDYELAYDTRQLNLGIPGSFSFDLQAEEQYTNTQTNADGSVSSYVGFFQYANEQINPHWKGLATLEYSVAGFTAHWDTRYIEGMQNFDDPERAFGNEIGNYYYHNVAVSYLLKDVGSLQSVKFVLGVNNLFDKDPPFVNGDSICKCNTLAGPYDLVGRSAYARVSAKF